MSLPRWRSASAGKSISTHHCLKVLQHAADLGSGRHAEKNDIGSGERHSGRLPAIRQQGAGAPCCVGRRRAGPGPGDTHRATEGLRPEPVEERAGRRFRRSRIEGRVNDGGATKSFGFGVGEPQSLRQILRALTDRQLRELQAG